MAYLFIISIFLVIFFIMVKAYQAYKNDRLETLTVEESNINEWSFQRYAKFYGNMVLRDDKFQEKMEKICDLVLKEKINDISLIAKESGCSYDECVLKIRYLKNKRKIGDLYIDHANGILKNCSIEDQSLLDRYSSFLYQHHLQIDEIARRMPHASSLNLEEVTEEVFQDLKHLDELGLINGIILNQVDKKIIYYSIEKHKNEKDIISINCPNCGALNDLNRGSKVRCEYCKTIISEDNISNN